MNKTVSLIIPIYNLSKTLDKCINSIVNQTYKELEIILINDGSTDSSLSICEKYATSDQRIKVLSHYNHGVSYTRNIGIKNATGYYLMFIDGDDVISSDMVETYVNYATKADYDIVIGGLYFVENKSVTNKIPKHEVLNRQQLLSNVCIDTTGIYGYVPNKLYKLKNIKDNQILFNEKMYAQEDFDFALSVYEISDKILQIPYSGYTYYHESGKRHIPMLDLLKNQIRLLNISSNNQVDKHNLFSVHSKISKLLYISIISNNKISNILLYKKIINFNLQYSEKDKAIKLFVMLFNNNQIALISLLFTLRRILIKFKKKKEL